MQVPKFYLLQNRNKLTKIDLAALAPLQHKWETRKRFQLHNQNHKNTRSLGGEK